MKLNYLTFRLLDKQGNVLSTKTNKTPGTFVNKLVALTVLKYENAGSMEVYRSDKKGEYIESTPIEVIYNPNHK